MPTRLQKFIASTGVVSRRKAEQLIEAGYVFVNKKKVTKLGTTIDPEKDVVMLNGKVVRPVTTFRYIAVNKPAGVICTRAQYKNEQTVYDIIPGMRDLVIAGRLDRDSDGLILLTNDGELTNQLMHPSFEHEKEYEITTIKPLDHEALSALKKGIKLEEGIGSFDHFEKVGRSVYRAVLHQGWKRQIRRMIGTVHNDVTRLTRIRINNLELGDLPKGSWQEVQRDDIV